MPAASKAARFYNIVSNTKFWRGVVAILLFLVLWETLSGIGILPIPAPSAVLLTFNDMIRDPSYWFSWYFSVRRVFAGFFAAMILGIPLGLAMAVSPPFSSILFPIFEVLRP